MNLNCLDVKRELNVLSFIIASGTIAALSSMFSFLGYTQPLSRIFYPSADLESFKKLSVKYLFLSFYNIGRFP